MTYETSSTSIKDKIISTTTKAYAASAADKPLHCETIERREPGDTDVVMEILYCGVCHSDLHTVRNEWGGTKYPCVPGHEMVGEAVFVGSKVTKHKIGETIAVGCLVDSCRRCKSCKEDLEQHCEEGPVFSYNSDEVQTGRITYGGYSKNIVVDEDFVLKVPTNLDLAAAAPLLCAGITTYSPLKRFNVGKGQKIGILGIGGLGHMGVKFAHAFGAHVTILTRSKHKEADAKKLGADEVILTTEESRMDENEETFDLILDTVSADHNINDTMKLIKRSGKMVVVGAPENPLAVEPFSLIFKRRQLAGSLIGGIKETQEMLNYCGKNNIVCDVEVIRMDQINEAYERMIKSDVKYRFVIDLATL